MKDDRLYLVQVLDCIDHIVGFTAESKRHLPVIAGLRRLIETFPCPFPRKM
jgi:hypothetical protein